MLTHVSVIKLYGSHFFVKFFLFKSHQVSCPCIVYVFSFVCFVYVMSAGAPNLLINFSKLKNYFLNYMFRGEARQKWQKW